MSQILKPDITVENVYQRISDFAMAIGEDIYRSHLLGLIEEHMKKTENRISREEITVDLLTANEQPKLHVLLDNKNDVCLNGNRIRLSSGQAVILG